MRKFKLVVVSGKGGTGKTTLTSSLAYLFDPKVIKVDCDVDASNLDIVIKGKIEDKKIYKGAKVAKIAISKCINCGICKDNCRFDAIDQKEDQYIVNEIMCEGCNACVVSCPQDAIELKEEKTADILKKDTEVGKLFTSKMIPGSEGSGKLVSKIRKDANLKGTKLLIDGSPGVGCSVMASVTGTDYSIIVTEPTKSGYDDLKRVLEIVNNFNSKPLVVINKSDINKNITSLIKDELKNKKISFLGEIPFDKSVSKSINKLEPVIKNDKSKASKAIKKIYKNLLKEMEI